ncbi:MAG: hypothetical protein WCG14_01595 [Chlamydiia bacterium]
MPIFTEVVVHINPSLAYQNKEGRVYYFNSHELPVFADEPILREWRRYTSGDRGSATSVL